MGKAIWWVLGGDVVAFDTASAWLGLNKKPVNTFKSIYKVWEFNMVSLPLLDSDEDGNEHLHTLLKSVHQDDVALFINKFLQQPLKSRFHTYHELLIGAKLRELGFDLRYERNVNGKTPDWSLLNRNDSPLELLDVLTIHQRHDKDIEIKTSIRSTGKWDGWLTVPPDHIYRKLNDKAGQYSSIAKELKIPFTIAVYGDFTAAIHSEDIRQVLFYLHDGLFKSIPEVSGLIYCNNSEFKHYPNPHAIYPSLLIN